MDTDAAVAEVAARLRAILDAHGADAIGVYLGTQAYFSTLTVPFVDALVSGIGTRKFFKTMTIDQSAKWIAMGRLGRWEAGQQRFAGSDIWMLFGTNPLVSMQGGGLTGFPIHGGRRALRAARAAGLRLVVVDPRRTETAREADRHIQLRPGMDALLAAAMLHVILDERLHDEGFCAEHVNGTYELREAVSRARPSAVADLAGVTAAEIVDVAHEFANARRGMATTGTGPDMGPSSNLNEHLVQALNVVCGRFPRAGEPLRAVGVLKPAPRARAQVVGPTRQWETGYRTRFGFGQFYNDVPTATVPREILEPAADRIRALLVVGGNPAAAIPDQLRTVQALSSLELLVALEPFPSETAQLADFVLAPTLPLERADTTYTVDDWYDVPFAQYTAPVLDPPSVRDDWRLLADIARSMGLPLRIGAHALFPDESPPTDDELIGELLRSSPAEDVVGRLRDHPHGLAFEELAQPVAEPSDGSGGHFDLLPADVAGELSAVLGRDRIEVSADRPYLLCVRRMVDAMNSVGRRRPAFAEAPHNPCRMHPDEMSRNGFVAGDLVRVASAHGCIDAVLEPDDTLRHDVVTLTHAFGDLPDAASDPRQFGSNVARLVSLVDDVQSINAMPRMSAVRVSITADARLNPSEPATSAVPGTRSPAAQA